MNEYGGDTIFRRVPPVIFLYLKVSPEETRRERKSRQLCVILATKPFEYAEFR